MSKMKELLVAVSGGIDSVVLLDMLVKRGEKVVVAHFDHGIRQDSSTDAQFVKELAAQYNVPFVTMREELGERASEALARTRRYRFLRDQATRLGATIVTAHHADDVIETIAINLTRGTGWRGLAVLNSGDVARPLLHKTKAELYEYALANRLEWVEDSTNENEYYLRNRIRKNIARQLDSSKKIAIHALWNRQIRQKRYIEAELESFDLTSNYSRYFFIMIPEAAALELLVRSIYKKTGKKLQRPQLQRAVLAIKTFQSGTVYEAGDGITLHFSRSTFIVHSPQAMV